MPNLCDNGFERIHAETRFWNGVRSEWGYRRILSSDVACLPASSGGGVLAPSPGFQSASPCPASTSGLARLNASSDRSQSKGEEVLRALVGGSRYQLRVCY